MQTTPRSALAIILSLALLAPTAVFAADEKKDEKKDVSKIGERDVGKGINLYSLESEIALGKQLSQQIEQTARLVQDPVVVAYVDKVAQNLVRNSDARVPFTVKVIDSEEINAFALPGGFFYINSGLVLAADEEAELAGVMAHEIAHVTARHATRQATKAQITQWALIPAIIFLPGGWAGYGIYQGLNFGLPLAFLKFSRDAEREADFLGVQYMYKAGYDPTAFISFFEKIREKERKQPGSVPKVFSSHPPTGERVTRAQSEIASLLPDQPEYVVSTSEFDQVRARLAQLAAGRKIEDEKSDRPTLRTREKKEGDEEEKKEEEKPPVLKRRD
ncbi:MAG TPA: M48 family metallopeptidase [Candidatus Acidoferrales bacterium]|nr:M48 family metallopeptidase [Candidatus Acidoferrales bacterium]